MTGPATVAVIAISPNPFFVMATSAEKSPSELAHARMERDSKACGNVVTNPRSWRRSTIELAAKLMTATLWMNPIIENTLSNFYGGAVCFVLK